MVKPVSDGSKYTRGYQQALNDFGITQLLSGIRSYSDEDFEPARAHESALTLPAKRATGILKTFQP